MAAPAEAFEAERAVTAQMFEAHNKEAGGLENEKGLVVDSYTGGQNGDVEKKGDHGGYMRIFTYAGTTEYIIYGVSILAAVASGAGIALQNLVFGRFVTTLTDFASGKMTGETMRSDSSSLALYLVYIGIGRFILSYTYNSLLTFNAYRVVRTIRLVYLKAALSQEIAYFDLGTGGSIATQATTNGRLILGGISEKLGLTAQGLSAFVTAFIVAFATNWKLTLITLCIAPATIGVMAVTAVMEAGHATRILDIYAQANSFAEGVLSSARTVHAFEMRSRLVNKFDAYLAEAHRVGDKISPLYGILFSSEYCIIYLGFGLAFWQGFQMYGRGEVESSGEIFTVLFSVAIAAISMTVLAPYSVEFTRAATGAAQMFALIDRQSTIDPFNESGEQPSEVIGHIELNNVDFAYPSRPGVKVLDNFSLSVPAGKVTALVGQSGSGKSTIVGLIERWYNVCSGDVKLDGRSITGLNTNWLRRNVRLVQQEPVLFQGSVFDNIRHGLVGTEWQDAPMEVQLARVQEAARLAFAHDFISELPEGYETQIGQRGGLLSGGQKQRIAIARSVVSEPKILLLDEATSALDPHAEGIVQEALDRVSKGRTTIVIAHKLATIRKADNIVVMKKGKIIEQGTHESLIISDGAYAQLVKVQNLKLKLSDDVSESEEEEDTPEVKRDPSDLVRPMTKVATQDRARMEAKASRDDYDNHTHLGLVSVVLRLVKESPSLRWWYILIIVGCVGASAAFPGQAILLANVSNAFTLQGSAMIDKGNFYAAMFIVLAAGCFISYFALGYATNLVSQTLSHTFRRQSFNDMLRQDLQFFDREENNTGALASRVDSNPQAILELMGFNVGLILISVLNILGCSVLGIVYSWKLGLVIVLAGLPPFVSSGFFKFRADAALDRTISKRNSTSAAVASEAVNAIRTVSSLAIEQSVLNRYGDELNHAVKGSLKPMLRMMIWFALTQSIEYWFMALGFWYGCRLVSFGEIGLFDFFVTFMGVFYAGQATAQLFMFSTSMTKGKNAANYIFWLRQLQPTVAETSGNADKGPKSGGPIELDSVRFSYPLRPDAQVLRGIDLEIKKGQFAAFVGASGCGKSTMIAMLERFYDPLSGSIRIHGDDLTELNPRLYRRIVSLVQQEPTLFQGTIRENIALGIDDPTSSMEGDAPPRSSATTADVSVSDTQIEAALRAANAWDFVSSLPEGLSTAAGSNGTQLSGGQRQRIAIARSLIRNPSVLLLDEATSALDTESEKIVQNALAEAAKKGDRITIAVAHRLSTIKDADVICVFYMGRIVEMGTHVELLGLGGMYTNMCEAQSLD